jgi:hypothetical protein
VVEPKSLTISFCDGALQFDLRCLTIARCSNA